MKFFLNVSSSERSINIIKKKLFVLDQLYFFYEFVIQLYLNGLSTLMIRQRRELLWHHYFDYKLISGNGSEKIFF